MLPAPLVIGDTILIIGTARARTKEALIPCIETLKEWGLNVIEGKNLYKKHNQFAGTDKERAHDLQWAINHKTAKAVLIAGGGYGTLRIIDLVNFDNLKLNPKWFIGYSDTTVLHARLLKLNIPCIHATMAFQFSKNHEATNSLKQILFNQTYNYNIPVNKLNKKGNTTAKIIGGNLSLIYALSGSIDEPNTNNKILFIEDLDEQLYHIDRMILQLKRSGKLKNLKGLIVGGMTEMKDNMVPFGKTAEEIIFDAVKEYNYPVCFNFPAGHVDENYAIILGKKAELNITNKKVELIYK